MSRSAVFGESVARLTEERRRSVPRGRTAHAVGLPSGLLEIAILALIALLLVVATLSTRAPRTQPPMVSQIKVERGDTLWNLATAHPVKGMTTAQVIDLVAEINHLDGGLIRPDETILVPTAALDERLASR